jgi:hypothetical protein
MSSEPITRRHHMGTTRTERRPGRAVALHLAAAVVVGGLADIGLRLGAETAFLFTAATPWVLVAFSAGRASAPRWSAVAGSGTLLVGLAAYYLWLLVGLGVSVGVLTGSGFNGVMWVVVGAAVGAVAGGIGGLTWHRRLLLAEAAWCGVVAVPCADGMIKLVYGGAPPIAATAVFGGAALALLAWAWRSGARTWVLALGVPLAVMVLWQLELVILQQVFGRLTWI